MPFQFVITLVSYSTHDGFYNENVKIEETVKMITNFWKNVM